YAWSTAKRLLLLALAVYAPLALLAPFAAAWVFGKEWQEVGSLLAVLAPACIAQSVVSPLSRSLLLNDREERKLIADLVCLILPASTLYLASSLPVVFAASCFAAASAFSCL